MTLLEPVQSRRQFLRHTAAAAGALALPAGAEDEENPRLELHRAMRPTGVPTMWLGAMTPTSATVKVKLPPGTPAKLFVRSAGEAPLKFSPLPPKDPASTVAEFAVTGLQPSTVYTYTLDVVNRPSFYPPGSFKTFPAQGQAASFNFAFASCAQTGSEHAVFTTIHEKQPAVFLHLGDFHYQNISRNSPRLYRAAWDTVLSSSTQGPLYRDVPLSYVWDDHDFGPNDSDSRAPAHAAAHLVYREYAPHYPLPAGEGDSAIYQAFSIARVRFIMSDLRGERSPGKVADGPGKSMLGARQKEWFKRELLEASRSHAMVFWTSSVPWIGARADDSWQNYEYERREIANFIAEHRISNLCILCGDAHMLAADDGRKTKYADGDCPPVPVLHGSALDQSGSVKGGPYSHGNYTPKSNEGCFGWVEVQDEGSLVKVSYTGRNHHDEVKVALGFSVGYV